MTPCRALVAGFGRPGMRDLDFGRQVVDCLQQLSWPEGVVVEDLPLAAPLVLHRLQELRPAKLVIVGAVPRHLDPPATVRRRLVDLSFSDPAQIHRTLEEPMTDMVDVDHTMAVVRHWGDLPAETVVIEVEPAETSFGVGFSEELAACLDRILDMVRDELAEAVDGGEIELALDTDGLSDGQLANENTPVTEPLSARQPCETLARLQGYAADHAQARLQSHRASPLANGAAPVVPGVALAGRVRPWAVFADSGGDWLDAVPLDSGGLGMVVGDVEGRGVEVAPAMSDLRAAVRAYTVLEGNSPARLLCDLDRLAQASGLGLQARLVYMSFQPATGELKFSSAGSCPPLVVSDGSRRGRFLDTARAAPLGAIDCAGRPEETLHLAPRSTLFLFTDGLVESRATSRGEGLERLRRAAVDGPHDLEKLCDHILEVCATGNRRDDDMCLLGVRRLSRPRPDPEPPPRRSQ